jgi:hypothetical protein
VRSSGIRLLLGSGEGLALVVNREPSGLFGAHCGRYASLDNLREQVENIVNQRVVIDGSVSQRNLSVRIRVGSGQTGRIPAGPKVMRNIELELRSGHQVFMGWNCGRKGKHLRTVYTDGNPTLSPERGFRASRSQG